MIATELERHFWDLFESGLFDEGERQKALLQKIQEHRTEGLGRHESLDHEGPTLSPSRVKMAHPDSCARQLALSRDGAEKAKPHPGQQLMWENGHQIHALFWAALAAFPPEWAREIRFEEYVEREVDNPNGEDPILLRGFVDLMILHDLGLQGPEWELVDGKTVRGAAFRYGEKDWPRETDALQVWLYDHILDEEATTEDGTTYPVTGGEITYIDREGQNFLRCVDVDLDTGRDETREVLERAARIVTSDEMPPVLDPVLKRGKVTVPWNCLYCSWHEVSCPGAQVPQ